MYKKVAIIAIAVVLLLGTSHGSWRYANAFGTGAANVSLFGVRVTGAVLFEGRAYVPSAALKGVLGHTLAFDVATLTLLFSSGLDTRTVTARLTPYKGHATVRVIVNQREEVLSPPALYHKGIVYVPLRLLERLGVQVGWDFWSQTAYAGTLNAGVLPRVGTRQNLERLLSVHAFGRYKTVLRGPVNNSMESTTGRDHSQTNIQVAGVDEADIAKTDGEYIYQVRGREVTITRAYPPQRMEVLSSIAFGDVTFWPEDLFVDERLLVVIGRGDNRQFHDKNTGSQPSSGGKQPATGEMARLTLPRWWGNPTTKAYVYDLTERGSPRLLREVEIEGGRLATRKIGSVVYLLSNRWTQGPQLPYFRDTAAGKDFAPVEPSDIKYFPDRLAPSYLMVAAFDLNRPAQAATVSAYLGAGNEVYMSHRNVYVAVGDWQENTVVHKLAVDGVDVAYSARGAVKGTILNQFSMDEHNGYFRTATTIWSGDRLSNAIFVLDNKMQIVGSIEGIAPNERIYSARFMGNRGYMVTFELIDPLFVIDLSEPRRPKILGELKIPGFSNYLHPIDDNHLLGIGRDTAVATTRDHLGRAIGQVAIELGIKLAIFDVTDVANPIEEHVEIIGGRGTYSEVLNNHKALLFDKRNSLLAFPITIHTAVPKPEFNHGPMEFQGAVVYDISLERGFLPRARISHSSATEDLVKRPIGSTDGGDEVRRVLYIGDYFYVLSDNFVSAHHGPRLDEVRRMQLPRQNMP